MIKKIITIFMLMALILIPMYPRAAVVNITRAHTASKYVTRTVDNTAYTVSGTVNYDKNSGLATKDYISWHGNISHNNKECDTDYVMYIQGTYYKSMHLPFVKGQKSFFEDKKVNAGDNSYANLKMDTLGGQFMLRANE